VIESPKQPSLFKLLDEECMMKGNDPNLLKKYNQFLESNKSFQRSKDVKAQVFTIKHYAGDVLYDVTTFCEKNKDAVSETVLQNLSASTSEII